VHREKVSLEKMSYRDCRKKQERYRAIQDTFVHRRPSSSPVVVEIEPSTACDLDCVFCPREALCRPAGHLSLDAFRLILRNLGPPSDGGMLLFSGFGEPLAHGAIAILVEQAKRTGWFCGITTNGTGISEPSIHALLSAGLDVLQVSLHAATDRTYRRITNRDAYAAVVNNIQSVLPMCTNRIVLALNFTVTPWNRHEIPGFASYWKDRGLAHINFSRCHNRGGRFHGFPHASSPSPPSGGHADCWAYRHALYVAWDGGLLACCNDLTGETRRGDLRRTALREILEGDRDEVPPRGLCGLCDFPFR
jgi:pyruvate-formate lyase-activating enzyme